MTSSGVIPRPEDREPPRLLVRDDRPPRQPFTQTGAMDAGDGHIVFGHEGPRVIVMCDHGDIVFGPSDQDTFARQLFRAMECAEVISAAEMPF